MIEIMHAPCKKRAFDTALAGNYADFTQRLAHNNKQVKGAEMPDYARWGVGLCNAMRVFLQRFFPGKN